MEEVRKKKMHHLATTHRRYRFVVYERGNGRAPDYFTAIEAVEVCGV